MPDLRDEFEALMPEPDIRIDAFGEIIPTDRRMFVMGDFYTADQMRKAIKDALAAEAKAANADFEQWAKERGHPLCDVVPKYGPTSSAPETELRFSDIAREAWIAATERAAKKEREAALDDAYNAMFHIKGCKVTRFDAQTAIAKLKEKA